MTRYIHHDVTEVHVVVRDPDGGQVWSQRATGVVGSPMLYGMMLDGMRNGLRDGEWLDTSEADTAHERVLGERDECIRAVHG